MGCSSSRAIEKAISDHDKLIYGAKKSDIPENFSESLPKKVSRSTTQFECINTIKENMMKKQDMNTGKGMIKETVNEKKESAGLEIKTNPEQNKNSINIPIMTVTMDEDQFRFSKGRNKEKVNTVSSQSVVEGRSLNISSLSSKIVRNHNANVIMFEKDQHSTDEQGSCISIAVTASRFEAMYPIWVEDSKKISFQVEGEWKIGQSSSPFTDIRIMNENSFSSGTLIGRVLGGDYFAVNDGLVYESRTRGPLFLKTQLNSQHETLPKGVINVKICGCTDMSFDAIEEKIGWNKEVLIPVYTGSDSSEVFDFHLPEFELSTIMFLNKMRINPQLFALQYIEGIRYLTKSTMSLYEYLITFTQSLPALKINIDLVKLSEECNKSLSSIRWVSESIMREIEKKLNTLSQTRKIKLSFKKHDDTKPLSLAIKLMLTEQIRLNVFNKTITEMGIYNHPVNGSSRYQNSLLLFCTDREENDVLV